MLSDKILSSNIIRFLVDNNNNNNLQYSRVAIKNKFKIFYAMYLTKFYSTILFYFFFPIKFNFTFFFI